MRAALIEALLTMVATLKQNEPLEHLSLDEGVEVLKLTFQINARLVEDLVREMKAKTDAPSKHG